MAEWTSPPRAPIVRSHDCMAAFFTITGILVFLAALAFAFGFVSLVP